MIEYTFPILVEGDDENLVIENGNFGANIEKKFYYVIQKYDEHNYNLTDILGLITPATQERVGTTARTPIAPTEVNIIGFTQPYSFAVTSGTLPAGLVLNTGTGVISGTPSEETPTRIVVITLTDVNGLTGSQTITFQFDPAPELYAFTSATFTSGGAFGRFGPTLAQARAGLTGTGVDAWKNDTAFFNTSNGIQIWTVPKDATYRIEARGATGAAADSGSGGRGAKIRLDVNLVEGDKYRILVGQPGRRNGQHGGGGGGTYVIKGQSGTPSTTDIVVIAGGGGGRRQSASGAGIDGNFGQIAGTVGDNLRWGLRASANSSGTNSGQTLHNFATSGWTPTGTSLTQGGPGTVSGYGDGGGGIFGNGFEDGSGPGDGGGRSFTNGAAGGNGSGADGGFGGGGSGQGGNGGGGGGGYTGGSGGHTAGGGGSFVSASGTNLNFTVDGNPGPAGTNIDSQFYSGFVTITAL